jgi:hypothetical protein
MPIIFRKRSSEVLTIEERHQRATAEVDALAEENLALE